MADGEEQPKRPFGAPPTDWSVVQGSGIDSEVGRAKLSTLLEIYASVVYRSLRARGIGESEARDLTQGFVVKLLEGKVVGNADPQKGSFCTFLVDAAWDYARNAWRDAGRQKRGGGVEHVSLADAAAQAPASDDAPRATRIEARSWSSHAS